MRRPLSPLRVMRLFWMTVLPSARSLPRASMGFAPFFISCFAMLSGCFMVMSQLSTTVRVLSPTIRKMVSQYSARTVQSSIRTSVVPLCPSVMNHTGR